MVRQRNSGKRSTSLFNRIEKEVVDKRQSYVMDLRVHTPNSLGYRGIEGLDTAPALVRLARVKGIDVLGVTDYYCGDFIDRLRVAAQDSSLTVIPGIDLRLTVGTCDDVEMSCLFPETFTSDEIRSFLDGLGVPSTDTSESIFRIELPLDEVIAKVESADGVMLPSRMDRTPSRRSAIAVLVEEYGFRTFDLAHADSSAMFEQQWPHLTFNLFSFSNANALAQVGSRIAKISLVNPTFAGLKPVLMRELR